MENLFPRSKPMRVKLWFFLLSVKNLFFESSLFSFVEEENKNIFVKMKSKHYVCGHGFILLQLCDERS